MASGDEINLRASAINSLVAFDAEVLHVDDRPALSLADAKSIVHKVQAVLKPFTRDVIELLDDPAINRLRQQGDAILEVLRRATQYRPEAGQAKRDEVLRDLKAAYESLWRELRYDYTFAVVRQLQPELIEAKIDAVQKAAEKSVRDSTAATAEKSEALLKELQGIADSAQKAAGLTGAAANAKFFDDAASAQSDEARAWGRRGRWAAGWLIVAIAFVALLPFLHAIPGLSWLVWTENAQGTAQLLGIKVLVVVPLLYWVVLCARNYMAHKHNEVVNRHRQNALQTFKALVDAAKEPSKQDIILTKAAECIFGHQETGFVKAADSGEGPKSIVEVFKKD